MQNPYIYMLKRAYENIGDYKKQWILSIVLLFFSNLVQLSVPFIFGRGINVLQLQGREGLHEFFMYMGIAFILPFVFWILHGNARILERKAGFIMERNLQSKLYEYTTDLPLKWHSDQHSGRTIDKIEKAKNSLGYFGEQGFQYMETIIQYIGAIIALTIIFPWFGVAAFVFTVIQMTMINAYDKKLFAMQKKINKKEHHVAAGLYDYISNITTVITLRIIESSRKEIYKRFQSIFPIYSRRIKLSEIKWFSVSILISIMTISFILVYVVVQFQTSSVIAIGTLYMLYEYLRRVESSFYQFAFRYGQLVEFQAKVSAADSIIQAHDHLEKISSKKITSDWKNIHIQNLSFKHQENVRYDLHDLSFTIARGKKIALVGHSGSGKSTLMSLLRGLYKAEDVSLDVDGKKYSDIRALSEQTTLIPQEPEIFENTIEYNVSVGLGHKKSEIKSALSLAQFNAVLNRLPNGINTDINEKGVNLSGGEKQRLALARGIFAARKSSIILLDESTSSVDVENEVKIYENLVRVFKNESIIASIHKLHLIPMFDEVYVMRKGKIIEHGTPNELIHSNGEFSKMWKQYQKEMNR